MAHPGLPVGPAAQRPLRPQPLSGGEPVTLEAADEIGDVTFERIHRRRRPPPATNDSACDDQRVADRLLDPGRDPGDRVDMPAATSPDANASCSTGSSSHSAPRAATTAHVA